MSYFIPTISRIRFTALPDVPGIEDRVETFLSEGDKSWNRFDTLLGESVIPGTPQLGVGFSKGKSFVSDGRSIPQISFADNPPSLLFVYGEYQIAGENIYYDEVKGYFRLHISPVAYDPSITNLSDIWRTLEDLDNAKVGENDLSELKNTLTRLDSVTRRLAQRSDPFSSIQPLIASYLEETRTKLNDLQGQINNLQPPTNEGTLDLTTVYSKGEADYLLSLKATEGYVSQAVSDSVKRTDFDNHLFDNTNPHRLTNLQVGAPSASEHQQLETRVTQLENRILQFEQKSYVESVVGINGIVVTNQGAGEWRLDGADIDRPALSVVIDTPSNGTVSYTLTATPNNVVMVFVGGNLMSTSEYSILGNILTFSVAPALGERVVCIAD